MQLPDFQVLYCKEESFWIFFLDSIDDSTILSAEKSTYWQTLIVLEAMDRLS